MKEKPVPKQTPKPTGTKPTLTELRRDLAAKVAAHAPLAGENATAVPGLTRILVSTSELFALWRAIETVSVDPLIGLKLGVETKTERFHPMGIAALYTQNLVAAAEHMARYKKLTAPEEILTQLDEKEFSIGFRWLLAVDAERSSSGTAMGNQPKHGRLLRTGARGSKTSFCAAGSRYI